MQAVKRIGICVAALVLVAGCATMGGQSDEDMIRATVGKVKTALESQNLDMLMETFSEDFEHPEVGGKAEGREMLQMGIEMGYADEGEVYLEDMEIEIDGETATVYPVDLSGPPGSISVELTLQKEEDGWLIIYIDAEGV